MRYPAGISGGLNAKKPRCRSGNEALQVES